MVFAVMMVIGLLGLVHWILTDPEADREIAKERFRVEQEYREFRRTAK